MKEKIKYVGAMLICFIAVLFMQMPVLADDGVPATAWRDNAAAAFAGGSGTAADPYLITDGAQLAKVAKDVEDNVTVYKDVYFRLENDIDLSAHRWNPIGVWKWYENGASENKTFAGFLDGNGKTITGLIVDERTEKNSAGLFGNIGDNAGAATNVGAKDLNIVDARIYATDEGMERSSSAILAGYVMANFGHTIRFDNISVSGTITNTKVGKTMISGGLIGEVCRATVDNCQADVTIKGGDNTGGFVGIDASSTYTNCKVTGKVTGLWAIGGFVGYAQEADPRTMSTFKNCVAEVDIVASDWRAGGFSGYMEKGKASSCAALGDVTSSVTGWNPKVGGFVGTHTEGTYTECSFDSEKNPGLAAYGEGDEAAVPVEAGTTTAVSGNLCEDIYGGHAWESDYTVDVAPTCGTSGSESIHCSRCGNSKSAREIPATGSHDWQWVIDTPAAVGVAGSKHEQCSICAATKPAVTIPALEDAGASGAGSSGTETSGNTSSGTTAAGSAAAPADTNAAQPSAENNTGVTPPKTGEDPVTVVYLLLFASMIGMALVRRKKHFKDSF